MTSRIDLAIPVFPVLIIKTKSYLSFLRIFKNVVDRQVSIKGVCDR